MAIPPKETMMPYQHARRVGPDRSGPNGQEWIMANGHPLGSFYACPRCGRHVHSYYLIPGRPHEAGDRCVTCFNQERAAQGLHPIIY